MSDGLDLPTRDLTPREAFEAMRCFLEQFNERKPPERRLSPASLMGPPVRQGDGTGSGVSGSVWG